MPFYKRFLDIGLLCKIALFFFLVGISFHFSTALSQERESNDDSAIDILPDWKVNGIIVALNSQDPDLASAALSWLKEHSNNTHSRLLQPIESLVASNDINIKRLAVANLFPYRKYLSSFQPKLIYLLSDTDEQVRSDAWLAITLSGTLVDSYLANFVGCLESDDGRTVQQAYFVFSTHPESIALYSPNIAGLLSSKNSITQQAATDLLAQLGPSSEKYESQIELLLSSENETVCEHAIAALADIAPKNPTLIPTVGHFIESNKARLRTAAIRALGKMDRGVEPYTRLIIRSFGADDSMERDAAASAIATLASHSTEVTDDVARLLNCDNELIYNSAISCLGQSDPTPNKYVSELAKFLNSKNPETRKNAAQAVSHFGESAKQYIPIIVEMLKSNNESEVDVAGKALVTFGKNSVYYVPQLIGCFRSNDNWIRMVASNTLSSITKLDAHTLHEIGTFANSDNPDIRRGVIDTLLKINNSEAVLNDVLRDLSNSSDPDLLYDFLNTCDRFPVGRQKFLPKIARLLRFNDDAVSRNALVVLGEGGHESAPYVAEIAKFLDSDDSDASLAAINTLGRIGKDAASFAQKLVPFLESSEPGLRTAAAIALVNIGAVSESYITKLPPLLLLNKSDKSYYEALLALNKLYSIGNLEVKRQLLTYLGDKSPDITKLASDVIRAGDPLSLPETLTLLELARYNPTIASERCLDAYLSATSPEQYTVIRYLMPSSSVSDIIKISKLDKVSLLQAACDTYSYSDGLPLVKNQTQVLMSNIVYNTDWKNNDVPLLSACRSQLFNNGDKAEAESIDSIILSLQPKTMFHFPAWLIIAFFTHAIFWTLLIVKYPSSPKIQAIFFWNKWVRVISGCFYVHVVLLSVPFLRRRLLAPFHKTLIYPRDLYDADVPVYFADASISRNKNGIETIQSIKAFLSSIQGQIVIVGVSGLGKTTLLKHFAATSGNTVALLKADECQNGVEEAIQRRLKGIASDIDFLRSLIHAGALIVCIDAINETNPETRFRISQFLEENQAGTFVVTTQPLSIRNWNPPATAEIYSLESLDTDQIRQFLIFQWEAVKCLATISYEKFVEAIDRVLLNINNKGSRPEL